MNTDKLRGTCRRRHRPCDRDGGCVPAQASPASPNASDLPIASAALAPDFLDPLTNAGVLAVERSEF